ncbi:head-tail connector protein [Devosia submarina]|uniref:head-tail connector protein n=1 Tax=Devosia submarina TaxID=1173082 RepID=UPI000D34C4E1|nr:head-tail connector protein [Devosia submarina]
MANVVITQLGPLYSIEEVKQHLRVEGSDDDELIEAMMDAAEQQVLQYCNISLVPYGKEATFKVAALMAITAMYDNRAGEGEISLPASSRNLINPYRWLRV